MIIFMEQSKEKILKIASLLPWGAKKELSKRTGISEKTIVNFFKGGRSSFRTRSILMYESQKLIREHNSY